METLFGIWGIYFVEEIFYLCEYIYDLCCMKKQIELDFIENEKGQIRYSFVELLNESNKFVTVHYTLCNNTYQILLQKQKNISFKKQYNKVKNRVIRLLKRSQNKKNYILSAVLKDINDSTYRITNELIEHSGPFGDFYECVDYNYPMSLIIEKSKTKNEKTYTTLLFIDNTATRHTVELYDSSSFYSER